jgi:hypothetical protein
MKRIVYYFLGPTENLREFVNQNPDGAFTLLIILFLIILLVFSKFLHNTFPKNIIDTIASNILFVLFGILGLIIIKKKEVHIFIIPIRGFLAILIGLFMTTSGFGLTCWSLFTEISRMYFR